VTSAKAPPAPLPSHKSSRQILAIQLAAAVCHIIITVTTTLRR
jgi:hypothetical protein